MGLEEKTNIPDYVVLSGDEIKSEIIIDFDFVRAKVDYLAPNGISAIITHPEKYRGTKVHSPHIPYFAMPYKKLWYSMNGQITEKGMNAILDSVRTTFDELEVFHNHKQEIKRFYENIPERNTAALLREEYNKKKKTARRLLKSKVVNNKPYQKRLQRISSIQKAFENAEYKTMEKLSRFVQERFSVFMHMDARDLLMEILEA